MTDAAVQERPLDERLLRGAIHLGKLWFAKTVKADCGWTLDCKCPQPSAWCKAKTLWYRLAVEDGRVTSETEEGPFALVGLMRVDELAASALTVTFELPDLGKFALGPKGQMQWEMFLGLVKDREGKAFETVFAILKNFPGAKVVK